MGDFNADLLSKSSEAAFLKDLVNQGPTNHAGNSHTCIDMICFDDNDEIMDRGQVAANFNNTHDLIYVTIKPHIITPPTASFSYRKYKDITLHNLTQYLETCDWTALLSSGLVFDLESGLNGLSSNLQMAIEELVPLKMVTPHKENRPWNGPDLQFLIHKCDANHTRYGRTQDAGLLLELHLEIGERTENVHNELNSHFADVSVSPLEDTVSQDWFKFEPVTINNVILAIFHFSSQARG